MAIHKNQLYLIGRNLGRGADWVWRFARISAVTTLKRKAFDYPSAKDFDPQTMFADSFGIWLQPTAPVVDVEVLLDPNWKAYANAHRWHRSQAPLLRHADGRIRIRLKVKICRELKQWILGFGGDAEVVAPKQLRREISEELRSAAKRYATDPVGSAGGARMNDA